MMMMNKYGSFVNVWAGPPLLFMPMWNWPYHLHVHFFLFSFIFLSSSSNLMYTCQPPKINTKILICNNRKLGFYSISNFCIERYFRSSGITDEFVDNTIMIVKSTVVPSNIRNHQSYYIYLFIYLSIPLIECMWPRLHVSVIISCFILLFINLNFHDFFNDVIPFYIDAEQWKLLKRKQ